MVEPSARYEEIQIPLPEPVHGLESVSTTCSFMSPETVWASTRLTAVTDAKVFLIAGAMSSSFELSVRIQDGGLETQRFVARIAALF